MAEITLKKLLEHKNGITTWNISNEESIVYLMIIGNDSYVGATYQPKNRFRCHLNSLLEKKHSNPLIQNAFDKSQWLKIYLLEDCGHFLDRSRFKREKYYILKIRPTLNREEFYKSFNIYGIKDETKILPNIIKRIRKIKNKTLKSLEQKTNIEWRLIRDFEKGIINLPYKSVESLINELKIEIHKNDDNLYVVYGTSCDNNR